VAREKPHEAEGIELADGIGLIRQFVANNDPSLTLVDGRASRDARCSGHNRHIGVNSLDSSRDRLRAFDSCKSP